MGKHGPCRHCGVTTTPLWRNGPPDKPVLCNACGSRWRTKGSLTNYTPLHAREPIDSEEFKFSRVKTIPFKPKEKKLPKIRLGPVAVDNERETLYSDQNFRKMLEGDTSNRSSSGSAASYSESCAHFGTPDASELTGSAQSTVWESQVPSKRRTGFIRTKPSPVEKLTRELYTILHEDQSSYFSSSEDLLYENETPMGSFEIGNGSVLLRYPNPKTIEEESEASSLPIDNKSYVTNEAYSASVSFPINSASKITTFSSVGIERLKKPTTQMPQEHMKREKTSTDNLHILRKRDSPLAFVDMQDLVNFEVFMKHMTNEEQLQLMKYLPSVDTVKYPESIMTMFSSAQFVETLSHFQQLLQEGMFEPSIYGVNSEEVTTLKRLLLNNLKQSAWVEYYKKLKNGRNKQTIGGKEVASIPNFVVQSSLSSLKRSRDAQNLHKPALNGLMRSPKRVSKCSVSGTNPYSTIIPQLNSTTTGSKLISDSEDFIDNDGSSFSPRTFFASPPDRSSMLCSLQFTDDNSDHDLLVDVPCNTSAFPEAQLLYPWNQKPANNSADSGVIADGEESLSNFRAPAFRNQKPKR